MSSTCGRLVDGRGVSRVARALCPPRIALVRAQSDDCDRIHAWRNDEVTRRHFHDPGPIALDDHRRWFAEVLRDDSRDLLVAMRDGAAAGVLRFDVDVGESAAHTALVSIYLVPGNEGRGLGPAILAAGNEWIAAHRPDVARLRAEVHAENTSSIEAFLAAGYLPRVDDAFEREVRA
jgi:RimJ/RimL family protein N-acetyltransferase